MKCTLLLIFSLFAIISSPLQATELSGYIDQAHSDGTVYSGFASKPSSAMDIAQFMMLAERNDMRLRCRSVLIPAQEAYIRIDWAVQNGALTHRAGAWARFNGYYPVIDFFTLSVAAVCQFKGSMRG